MICKVLVADAGLSKGVYRGGACGSRHIACPENCKCAPQAVPGKPDVLPVCSKGVDLVSYQVTHGKPSTPKACVDPPTVNLAVVMSIREIGYPINDTCSESFRTAKRNDDIPVTLRNKTFRICVLAHKRLSVVERQFGKLRILERVIQIRSP
jgi:hypothetical protein